MILPSPPRAHNPKGLRHFPPRSRGQRERRNLAFAGIAKRDERGRTACVHSLRHTFATLMSRGGVAPRVAQAAMRHASVEMTLQTYTDPKLLDVGEALRVLPELPIPGTVRAVAGAERAAK